MTPKPAIHWPSLIQLSASLLAAVLLLGAAVVFVMIGLAQLSASGRGFTDLTQQFMIAGSLAFAGALVLPSAWYSWKRISNHGIEPVSRPELPHYDLLLTIFVVIVESAALFLGNLVSKNNQVAWLLLPPLNIIATGLPAVWLVYVGTHGLLPPHPRYKWGVFAGGLILGPLIILVLEIILIIGVGILAVVWIMVNPSLSPQFNSLVNNLQQAATNPSAILPSLVPFILNPGIIFLGFATVSVLIPIIEETIKPIGVWSMVGRVITPAQGFAFGILSGAGFGLFENLGNTSNGGEAWALLAGSRISTLLLHSFTAGLVGWGLASAWYSRRYLRLGMCFVAAVITHGLWNGLAILSAASSLQGISNVPLPSYLQPLGIFATFGIFALGFIVLVLFIAINAVFRRQIALSAPEPPGPARLPGDEHGIPQSSSTDQAFTPTPEAASTEPEAPGDDPTFHDHDPQQPAADNPS